MGTKGIIAQDHIAEYIYILMHIIAGSKTSNSLCAETLKTTGNNIVGKTCMLVLKHARDYVGIILYIIQVLISTESNGNQSR